MGRSSGGSALLLGGGSVVAPLVLVWVSICMISAASLVCLWLKRRQHRQREATDLAAALQISIADQVGVQPPARGLLGGGLQVHAVETDGGAGRRGPGGAHSVVPTPPDMSPQRPSIDKIRGLQDSLSIGSFFQLKRDWLLRQLAKSSVAMGTRGGPVGSKTERKVLQIVVRREVVFQDSYLQFSTASDSDLRCPLSVHFVGEAGRDDGGVTRDWYSVLSTELFNPAYALFTYSASDTYTFQINPASGVNPDHLDFFRFVGVVFGKAILDGCLLGAHFTRLFYKRLLDKKVTYHDMASVDVQFYKSLCWILENDLSSLDLGLTFTAEKETFGAYEEVELKADGAEIVVSEENKREYVDLLAAWRLQESVEPQTAALRSGLSRVVDLSLLSHFDETELEWLISGIPELDVADWRKNTVYKAGYADNGECAVIIWFWQLVESWDQEMRARLLQFVTGTSKVPYPEGFAGLRGSDGPRPFHIVRVHDITRLPQAHTCFNELILPDYPTYGELKTALETAMFGTGSRFLLR